MAAWISAWRPARGTSLRARLVLGMALIVGLLLLMAVGALWQLRELGLQMERVVEVHSRRADLAHRLHAAQLEWTERLRVLLVMADPEDVRAADADLRAAQERYLAAEAALGSRLDDPAVLQQVRSLREQVAIAFESTARTAVSGAGAEAALAMLLPAEAGEAQWRARIQAIVDEVTQASVQEASQAMERLGASASGVAATISEVSLLAGTQRELLAGVTQSITDLDDSTQRNAALSEQLAAAASGLQQRAVDLQSLVGGFRLDAGAEPLTPLTAPEPPTHQAA